MKIGIDFDNTIVDYNKAFHEAALEKYLIPSHVLPTKLAVRDYLRAEDKEDEWTLLQGFVYGCCMTKANMYDGFFENIKLLKEAGHSLCIVSHKTKHPYAGPQYDLHNEAKKWIIEQQVDSVVEEIFFEEALDDKIRRINTLNCHIFIDDLPQVLLHKELSKETRRILFAPASTSPVDENLTVARHWREIPSTILQKK